MKARYKQPEGERSDLITLPVQPRANGVRSICRWRRPSRSSACCCAMRRTTPSAGRRSNAAPNSWRCRQRNRGDVNGFRELVATARALARTRR